MKSTRHLIITVVVVTSALAAYVILFWSIYSIADETKSIATDTADQQARLNEERTLKNLSNDIRSNSNELESVVIAKDGDIGFIESLETLGKEQGVVLSIVSVTEDKVIKGSKFNNLVFQITVQGSWEKVVHFVNLLELMPYKTAMRSVGLDLLGDNGKTKSSGWRLAIEMTVAKEK